MASLDHANYRSCQLAIGMVPQLSRFEAALDILLSRADKYMYSTSTQIKGPAIFIQPPSS